MSKMIEDLPSLPSNFDLGSTSSKKLRVTLISSEWRSTKVGLSTIDRELAIQLAKHPSVEVSVYLPQWGEKDKQGAATHNVHLIEAEARPGFDPVDCLSFLPEGHAVDCVIGHGAILGSQVQFIKHHHKCKWIQIVHTTCEELGVYRSHAVLRAEKLHQYELKLCEKADKVVAVGPKLADVFRSHLRFCRKGQDVLDLTPGIFSELADVTQATEERETFIVLVFGSDDNGDFKLNGYDIAARAVAELKDEPQPYKLLFVGAPRGEEEKVKYLLLQQGIDPRQLTVRCLIESREKLAQLFCEVDLAIMPPRTVGFGVAALEAFSAGLPVLISGNSGLGEALRKVSDGSCFVVESEDPKDWAQAIKAVCHKDREIRLREVQVVRAAYAEKYSWKEQCDKLVQNMKTITFEDPEIEARNRDRDDDKRDYGSYKLRRHSENPRPLQQGTNKDISKESSTSSGPGDSREDLGSALSGYSSFSSKEVTSLHPESCSQAEEPRETREIQTSNRDSDDDERDCGSNKPIGPSENLRQMQQETIQDISKEPSTCRGPGDLPGDLVIAVSGYSSFPSKEVTLLDPECSLKAEDDSPASDTDNSPWTDKNVLSSILTSKGGVVDGEGVRLVYPPGAVDSPVNVNITFEDPSKYDGFLIRKDLENDVMFGAPILNLQPNGYFFKKPVTLTTKFAIQGMKCSDVLVMHGTDAVVGKSIWEDITENTQIDVENQDVTIVIGHFSRIVVLLKCTWTRHENIRFRFNSRAFHYTFLVLKKSYTSSEKVEREVEEELALLFVSQDVYHEQFYKKQKTSALVQLEKERFVKLHVRRTNTHPRRRIYHNEKVQLEIHIGEDYEVVEEKKELVVKSSKWWKAGEVVRVRLKANQDVRSLCGTITVRGEYGHISTWHFSEEVSDLCGYVRSLLGVEDAIFNLIPIARSLDMPDEVMKQVTKCWKDESKQLNIILEYWSTMEKNVAEDVDALRRNLEKLKQGFADHASYKVTERGQMLIRNLRELATKNAEAGLFHFCSTLLRDLCIEMESSAEGVEKAALSTNSAEYFLVNHSNENDLSSANRRPIPQDVASKYRQVFSLRNKPCLKTLLAITPYLIQNIKEIYVDCESTEPQNGLKGLSKEKVDHFVADVEKAEQEEDYEGLVFLICRVLEKLSKKNVKDPVLTEIEEMSESLEIRQMLKPLKRFFQHSRQDIRLHMRLHLFSRRLRDTLTRRAEREKIDVFPLHNVRNMLLSLIRFAKHDPSKIVRFELTDATNFPLSCYRENVTYNKPEATYSQMFRVKKESEEVLQLHAVALVHIEEDKERKKREIEQREKGSFQSEIVLHASGERAFDRCIRRHPNIAVLKLKDKRSGNLRVILCSRQQEKLLKVEMALERKLRLDFKTSKITWYGLKMASTESETGAFLSLRLVYKWGSERVVLDSKDFVTLANCSVGGPAFSETGQAAESPMMNPVSEEEREAAPSDTDSSGQQEKRKTASVTDDTDQPEVTVLQLKNKDLPGTSERLDHRRLPVDILLLTVEDWEFLSCLSVLNPGFGKFSHAELGYAVYLGDMGDDIKLNIAVIKCGKGAAVLAVENAVKVLGPKAVFAVGSCSGLDCENVKLGDVVVLDRLITYGPSKVTENGIEELGVKVPLKHRLSKLTTTAGGGWKPPLKDAKALEVKIHRGAFLSGQEVVDSPERCRALVKRFRGAVAIEGEGEGVYAAAHDLDIEWIVIKGISGFADGRKIEDSWRTFASLMAASLTAHILSDTIAFQHFPHYGRSSKEKNMEDNSGTKSCNQVRQKESDTQPCLGEVIYDALRQLCEMEAKGNARKTDPSLNLKKIAYEKGFEISDNRGEGNCMFFAISEQLELIQGVELSHRKLRKKVVRHLKRNPTLPDGTELFHFVEGYSSWDDYLKSMKADGTWGDHVILHGAANRFDTCIHVISSQRDYRDVIINPQCEDADRKRLVLGHLCELHYVSLIPRKGTAKRQKRRLKTDEDDAHLDWGGEKKKKHKSGAKRCKQ